MTPPDELLIPISEIVAELTKDPNRVFTCPSDIFTIVNRTLNEHGRFAKIDKITDDVHFRIGGNNDHGNP